MVIAPGPRFARATRCAALAALVVVSTVARPGRAPASSATPVMGRPVLIADQLARWFHTTGQVARLPGITVEELAWLFIEEGYAEGVRGDVAFAQAIFETGYFQFSGSVPPEANNYGGIGAPNDTAYFPTPRIGVRAQIQHLRAYADPAVGQTGTANPLVDPRFDLVNPKGRAPTWEQFGNGNWSNGPDYGAKVLGIYRAMLAWAPASLRGQALGSPIVGLGVSPGSGGSLLLDAVGGVYALGGAPYLGSIPHLRLAGHPIGPARVVAIAVSPDGQGYWILDETGGVFAFGTAGYFGSIPHLRLAGHPIGPARAVALAVAGSGEGYWIGDDAGGVFAFGGAPFHGATGGLVDTEAVALARVPSTGGYRITSADGGVFAYG